MVCDGTNVDHDRLGRLDFESLMGRSQPILAGSQVVELKVSCLVGRDLTTLVLRVNQSDLCARNHGTGSIENSPGYAAALGKLRAGSRRCYQKEESKTENPNAHQRSERTRLHSEPKPAHFGERGL